MYLASVKDHPPCGSDLAQELQNRPDDITAIQIYGLAACAMNLFTLLDMGVIYIGKVTRDA